VLHQNSVFHAVLQGVPWDVFDRLVAACGSDRGVRRLTTKSQFVALLYGQLAGASGLREIEAGLESHQSRLYHLGVVPARRSTLADANALRPAAVFAELFAEMAARAHRPLRRSLAGTRYLIDSTGLRLDARSLDWARFSAAVCGVKLHVVYDGDADRPVYAAITPARTNDITAAHDMPIEPGATYVFDLGYYDYAWWAKLDAAQCRIVTRFKKNTPLEVIETLPVEAGGPILSDRIGFLPKRQGAGRANPMGNAVREVRLATDTGKVLRILSNDLDAPASEIAFSTSAAGRSSCSSAGSSRPSKSPASWAPRTTPCAPRSPSRSSPSCCCAWPRPRKKPSPARSPSPASCAST
jgi:Domain of unknown function (DUF4372)/Transposase DDE domain